MIANVIMATFIGFFPGLIYSDNVVSDSAKQEVTSPDSTINIPKDSTAANGPKSQTADSAVAAKIVFPVFSDSAWWFREVDNKAFGVGERLEFSVKYGIMPAGTAIIEIPSIINFDDNLCYNVITTANTNDVISVFYKVRDSVTTVVDVKGLFTRQFKKHLREGTYKNDRMTLFNQRKHLAVTGNDTIPTYSFVQDPLSSLYYVRTKELVPGQPLMIDCHADKKNYPLKINVLRKETVEVRAGKFNCVVVEPVMRTEGIFRAKGPNLDMAYR